MRNVSETARFDSIRAIYKELEKGFYIRKKWEMIGSVFHMNSESIEKYDPQKTNEYKHKWKTSARNEEENWPSVIEGSWKWKPINWLIVYCNLR